MSDVSVIPERSGTAFRLDRGQTLTVIDPRGEQVADLLAFNADDMAEVVSSGRTLDYAETIRLTTGHILYSNRSQPMLEIVGDTVGRHDFLLTPCSYDTFHHFLSRLARASRLLRQSLRGAGALWSNARRHSDRVQLFHERAGRCRDRAAQRPAADEQGGRFDHAARGDGPRHRSHRMLGAGVERRAASSPSTTV